MITYNYINNIHYIRHDQRRDLKKKRGEPEGVKDYREIKRKIRTEMKMAKETWIQGQCQEVEE